MKDETPHDKRAQGSQASPEDYLRLAQGHMRNGQYDEAIAILKLGLNAFPNHGGMLYDLSLALESSGRLSEAVTQLEQSVSDLSDKLNSFKLLASIYKSQGRQDEAVAVYRVFLSHEKLQELFSQRKTSAEEPVEELAVLTEELDEQQEPPSEPKSGALEKKKYALNKIIKLRQSIEHR